MKVGCDYKSENMILKVGNWWLCKYSPKLEYVKYLKELSWYIGQSCVLHFGVWNVIGISFVPSADPGRQILVRQICRNFIRTHDLIFSNDKFLGHFWRINWVCNMAARSLWICMFAPMTSGCSAVLRIIYSWQSWTLDLSLPSCARTQRWIITCLVCLLLRSLFHLLL